MNSHYSKIFFVLISFFALKNFAQENKVETMVQIGHYGTVLDVAYSADGTLIASASTDNTIIVWEASSGRQLKTLIGHNSYVQSVVFSNDGKELLSVGNDKVAIQWELSSSSVIRVIKDSTDEIRSAIFSPQGNYILTGGYNTNAVLWNRKTGEKIKTFQSKPEVCYQCASSLMFSDDESKVYTSSENSVVIIWNIKTADTISTVHYRGGSCGSCNSYFDISKDNNQIALADYSGQLYLLDAKSNKIIKQLSKEKEDFNFVKFSSDNKLLITVSGYYGVIKVWDIASEKIIKEIKNGDTRLRAAVLSPDGKYIVGVGDDKNIKFWSFDKEEPVKIFDGVVTKIDAKNIGDKIYTINQIADTKLSPDGNYVAQCKRGSELIIWDYATGKITKGIVNESIITCIDFSPNSELVAGGTVDGFIKLWNVKSGKELLSYRGHGGTVFTLHFSVDGKQIISGGWDGVTRISDANTGKRISHFSVAGGSPLAASLSSNNLYAFTSNNVSNKIKINEIDTGEEIKSLIGHTDLIQTIEVDPTNPAILLSSSFDGSARLWNIETGFQILKITGHNAAVHTASFDNTGNFIVTGSADKTAKLWDKKSGRLIRTFQGHTGGVNYAKITPDGNYLITASRDHSVKIWDLKTAKLLITHVTFENKQWLAKTDEGYFEGTTEALKLLYFVKDSKTYSLDQFFEKLYKPGIYKKSLAMEFDNARGIDIGSLIEKSSPPKIELLTPINGISKNQYKEIIIKVTNTGGGISDLSFFQNGKRIEMQNKLPKSLPKKDQNLTLEYSFQLIPGNNEIKIIAYSDERVESKPLIVALEYEGAKKTSNLYVLAIGINEYKNAVMNLNYAKADAESFIKSLKTKSESLYKNIETFVLLDSFATKQSILRALDNINQIAKKEDVFYFYFAGHGSAMQQEFYFIPSECVSLYQEEKLMKEAISATELNQKLKEIAALKQVVILDACHSGTSTKILASRGLTEEKALAQLARSTGIHIMAAAGSEQQAIEFEKLGHGLFTHVLLEALNGKADGTPNDNKVTIYELKSYIDDQVPELSRQYQGTTQYPSTYSLGQDFPMVITEKKEK